MKLVRENINFERGQDPKAALNLGVKRFRENPKLICDELEKIVPYLKERMQNPISWTHGIIGREDGVDIEDDEVYLFIRLDTMTPVNVSQTKKIVKTWIKENTDFKFEKFKWKNNYLEFHII